MKLNPSLVFSGRCAEAFRRYASLFGGEILMPLAETPWSPRYGVVRDPFGVRWEINTEASPAS